LFSVDSSGNVVANSLRRNDFHWFTIFESIDGYEQDIGGAGGSFSLGVNSVQLITGADQYEYVCLYKRSLYQNDFSWAKKRSVKIGMRITAVINTRILFGTGECNEQAGGIVNDMKIAFLVQNGNIYGLTADGSSYTTSDFGAISAGTDYSLRIDFVPGVSAKFYIDGVLEGTITTNLPSGTSNADHLFTAYLETRTSASKTMDISYYDFWQAL